MPRASIRAVLSAVAGSALLLLSGGASTQPPVRRPVELDDFYRLESVSAAAISPGGTFVAVVRTVTVERENARRSEIWLAPTDGGAPARITSPLSSAAAPRWSPDGSVLAFTSRRSPDDRTGVWFLRLGEAGEAYQVEGIGGPPLWSPDGEWIAFTQPVRPRSAPEQPLSESERKIRDRFQGRAYEWLQYRFDGRGYLPDPTDPAATPPRELFMVPSGGGVPRQLTHLGVDVRDLAWLPDAGGMVIAADSAQRDEYTYSRADLWLVRVDGSLERLTDDGFDYRDPRVSPDGTRIVAIRQLGLSTVIAEGRSRGAPTDLYLVPLKGGAPANLTASWDLLPSDPVWSPDGRWVYFTGGTGGEQQLFRVSAAGGAVEQVTRGPRQVDAVSFSADFSRMAFVAGDALHPNEAFVARTDGGGETRLTRFNDPLLATLELGTVERVSYPSKDGTPIEGWLTLPPPARRHSPMPLILSIHGGPHGAYGWSFSLPFQLLAAQGYAVLATNPRGSTGYGEDFLWATWGGWGNKDAEDVLAGVEHVAARHPIDRSRLGVTGYSYGGFLTNWIITHDRRFKAAVSGAGISNWLSDYATADIPRTKESEFFGPPWEERSRQLLLEQSPVFHAKGVTTPTLFIQGEADYRVPPEQAEQMYLALRKQRVPARMVRYPETSHGGWSPWNQVHRYHEELAWWARYLGSPVP